MLCDIQQEATFSTLRSAAKTLITVFVLVLAGANPSSAGLSGENIIVVVNSNSLASRTIANHYVHLRDVPTSNVLFLNEVPDQLVIGLEDFKSKILKPVLDQVNERGLARHVRCIAYSSGFPTTVNVAPHHVRLPNAEVKKLFSGLASITSMTYFYRHVFADKEGYFGLQSNLYARGKFDRCFTNPFQGELGTAFDEAKKTLERGDALKAGDGFKSLFESYPSLAPLGILAAEAYAEAGDKTNATKMIRAAISHGWWSADYLRESDALSPLLGDAQIAAALPMLPNYTSHVQGPMAFSPTLGWTLSGYPVKVDQGGVPYMLSCCLAIVHHHGSSLEQAIKVLERSAKADHSFPKGDFRFANGPDVRARVRFPAVADALLFLQNEGFETDVFKSAMPTNPGTAVGLHLGIAAPDFTKAAFQFAPGAIAETLTSIAGDFKNKGQTKLTEYLHAGAAMSSGTVAEPYSFPQKFPKAMMYGYYAAGISAIEAFYLSIDSPYQLLIVGDPHCQPFAQRPRSNAIITRLAGETPKIRIQKIDAPSPMKNGQTVPARFMEIYLEGKLVKQFPAQRNIDMNLPKNSSGTLNVRVVVTGLHPSEPREAVIQRIDLQGGMPSPVLRLTERRSKSKDLTDDGSKSTDIEFEAQCPGADSIDVMFFGQRVGRVKGGYGRATIVTKKLGGGPLRFRPIAHFGDKKVLGAPVVDGE